MSCFHLVPLKYIILTPARMSFINYRSDHVTLLLKTLPHHPTVFKVLDVVYKGPMWCGPQYTISARISCSRVSHGPARLYPALSAMFHNHSPSIQELHPMKQTWSIKINWPSKEYFNHLAVWSLRSHLTSPCFNVPRYKMEMPLLTSQDCFKN